MPMHPMAPFYRLRGTACNADECCAVLCCIPAYLPAVVVHEQLLDTLLCCGFSDTVVGFCQVMRGERGSSYLNCSWVTSRRGEKSHQHDRDAKLHFLQYLMNLTGRDCPYLRDEKALSTLLLAQELASRSFSSSSCFISAIDKNIKELFQE